MSKITKHAKEVQLQHIFRLLLEAKTQEEIANELNIALKTVQRYTKELDKRYGEAQRQKTDDTLYLECALFKNRMLTLYRILAEKAELQLLKSSGVETAKCCEVAANIAIDVLKMESEGIKSVKELGFYAKQQNNRLFNSIQSTTRELQNTNITEQQQQQPTTTGSNNITHTNIMASERLDNSEEDCTTT